MAADKAKNYKQLVALIAQIETEDDAGIAGGEVNRSFDSSKITWQDHQTLFGLLNKIYKLEEYKKIAAGN